jgi:hypothetical protein
VSAAHLLDLLHEAEERGVTIRIMYESQSTSDEEGQALRNLGVALKTGPISRHRATRWGRGRANRDVVG